MNDSFADWHRAISIDLAGIDLAARWLAVEAVLADIDAERVAQLVQLAFGHARDSTDFAWLRRPFKDREAAFAMKGNEREMEMLAAAVILEVLGGEDEVAVLAAYLCDVTRFLGWTEYVGDLVASARRRLAELATARRTTKPLPTVKATGVRTKPLKDILDTVERSAYPSGDVFISAITKLATTSQSAITDAFKHADDVASWAAARVAVVEEETDLLWWLLSGRSSSLGAAWSEFAPTTVAVAAARELATRVVALPAPEQCDALLTQMLGAASIGDGRDVGEISPLEIPAALEALLADVDHDDASTIAKHSLRRALAIRAWEAATS